MQDLDLARRYRSVYLAGPTFNLLPTDDDALSALGRIGRHLATDGTALIPLFVPSPTCAEALGRSKETTDDTGATIRVAPIAETRDEVARTQVTTLRYERIDGPDHVVEERPWTLHWHTPEGFGSLVERAGLRTVAVLDPAGGRVAPDAEAFVFLVRHP
jgi:hypothetical protein